MSWLGGGKIPTKDFCPAWREFLTCHLSLATAILWNTLASHETNLLLQNKDNARKPCNSCSKSPYKTNTSKETICKRQYHVIKQHERSNTPRNTLRRRSNIYHVTKPHKEAILCT